MTPLNRKKKINSALKAHVKRKNAKLQNSNKPKYVSKAERARLALEAEQNTPEVQTEAQTQVTSEDSL